MVAAIAGNYAAGVGAGDRGGDSVPSAGCVQNLRSDLHAHSGPARNINGDDLLVHLSGWLQVLQHGLRGGGFLLAPDLSQPDGNALRSPILAGGSSVSAATAGAPVSKAAPTMRLRVARTGRRRSPLVSALRYVVVGVALVFFLFPIFWIAGTSLKLPGEFLSNPPVWIP